MKYRHAIATLVALTVASLAGCASNTTTPEEQLEPHGDVVPEEAQQAAVERAPYEEQPDGQPPAGEGAEEIAADHDPDETADPPAGADMNVTVNKPVTTGRMEPAQVRAAVEEQRGTLDTCVKRAEDTAGADQVEVEYIIASNGEVMSAVIQDSNTTEWVEDCLAERVSTWSFPKLDDPADTVVVQTFVFGET